MAKEDKVVVYPVIMTHKKDGTDSPYLVEIPVIGGLTQGTSLRNAIEMARDYIGLNLSEHLDNSEEIPEWDERIPSGSGAVVLVDVNVDKYRREHRPAR